MMKLVACGLIAMAIPGCGGEDSNTPSTNLDSATAADADRAAVPADPVAPDPIQQGDGNSNEAKPQDNHLIDLTEVTLNHVKSSVDLYRIRFNSMPESLESLRDGPTDPAQKAKWVTPILKEIPSDGWGNELVYMHNAKTYELRSAGSDGILNTDDDMIKISK